jgi:conjugative transfer region protein (TIGR03750 family)
MLNHINHKMPIYKDCTIGEVMAVAIASLVILTLGFALLTKILFGYIWPGYLLASALFFFITKLMLSKLQKLKYGKPYGYYQHLLIKKLSETGLIHNKYLTRLGRWSVRRFLK